MGFQSFSDRLTSLESNEQLTIIIHFNLFVLFCLLFFVLIWYNIQKIVLHEGIQYTTLIMKVAH